VADERLMLPQRRSPPTAHTSSSTSITAPQILKTLSNPPNTFFSCCLIPSDAYAEAVCTMSFRSPRINEKMPSGNNDDPLSLEEQVQRIIVKPRVPDP
jgi:hypothetical protein